MYASAVRLGPLQACLIAAADSQLDVELMQFGTLKMIMAQHIRTEDFLEVGSSRQERGKQRKKDGEGCKVEGGMEIEING